MVVDDVSNFVSRSMELEFPESFRTWQKFRLEQAGLGLIVPAKETFPGVELSDDVDVIAAMIQALSGVDFPCPAKGREAVDLAGRLAIVNLFPAGAEPNAWICTHSAYIETIHGLYWALIKRYEAPLCDLSEILCSTLTLPLFSSLSLSRSLSLSLSLSPSLSLSLCRYLLV